MEHARSIDILVCDAGAWSPFSAWTAPSGPPSTAAEARPSRAAFSRPSGDLAERAGHPTFRGIVAKDGGHMILGRGGVPIIRDGQVIGGGAFAARLLGVDHRDIGARHDERLPGKRAGDDLDE